MKRLMSVVALSMLMILPTVTHAQDFARSRLPEILAGMVNLDVPTPEMERVRLLKAEPDECFDGIGQPYPEINADGTCSSGVPKRNQAYVWGLAESNNKLYFGTASNVLCQAIQTFAATAGVESIQFEGKTFVCEGDVAQSGTGDARPAKIFAYQKRERTLIDITPSDISKVNGIRSAGSIGDIVFLAGPSSLVAKAPITMFAFDASTDTYLGSHTFEEYTDIRKWVVFKGALYTGVQNDTTTGGGSVLRWRGSKEDLWNFEVVGSLPNGAANITIYGDNRLAVSTWPYDTSLSNVGAGVYLSPRAFKGGLSAADAGNWKQVFLFSQYEPDTAVMHSYGGGDLAFYRGWLYWGSMHLTGYSALIHKRLYGDNAASDTADLIVGTWRATSVWRGRNLETDDPEIELLYGETQLAKYDWDPVNETGAKTFSMVPTGWTPKYGKSGFGNLFNGYTWVMAVANESLFLGTFDVSYILNELGTLAETYTGIQDLNRVLLPVTSSITGKIVGFGADIWRFDGANGPARLESRNGEKNQVNYGFRTMLVGKDGKTLYVGTANPFNVDPRGGWELLRLTPRVAEEAE